MSASRPVLQEWDDRISGIIEIGEQIKALSERRKTIGLEFVAALGSYETMISEHRLGITVPCGFRADPPMLGRRGTFWRFDGIDENYVWFTHDCERDHYTVQSDSDEWLRVPIMFFTHPDEWLLLTALAAPTPED